MTFRIISGVNGMPDSWPVDPNATFVPGMLGQLYVVGNQVVMGVSDGRAPICVLDDVRTKSFYAPVVDEIVLAPVSDAVPDGYGYLISTSDIKTELQNPVILASSFVSDPVAVTLNARNGVITFLAGTKLNYSSNDSGVPDSIRTRVNYSYQVPNIPGDDSTAGNGRVTGWFQKMRALTDQYDPSVRYPLNAVLYSTIDGRFTTTQSGDNYPGIGMVTGPPTQGTGSLLEFLFF